MFSTFKIFFFGFSVNQNYKIINHNRPNNLDFFSGWFTRPNKIKFFGMVNQKNSRFFDTFFFFDSPIVNRVDLVGDSSKGSRNVARGGERLLMDGKLVGDSVYEWLNEILFYKGDFVKSTLF